MNETKVELFREHSLSVDGDKDVYVIYVFDEPQMHTCFGVPKGSSSLVIMKAAVGCMNGLIEAKERAEGIL